MGNAKKVVVGISGGIDSAVAALLLKRQGYEVEALSLLLHGSGDPSPGLPSTEAAARIAESIGLRLHRVDAREEFRRLVIEPFVAAYRQGVTPNPCIMCNRSVKFPFLIRKADELGASLVATGHYAVIRRQGSLPSGGCDDRQHASLWKGRDSVKDQSYVLYNLAGDTLERLIMPLGSLTKEEVRRIATQAGIAELALPESKEICFMDRRGFSRFMKEVSPSGEGPLIDTGTGRVVGRHAGIHLYTVGQRKRLVAVGRPRYVVAIDKDKNAVYIGPREQGLRKTFAVSSLNMLVNETSMAMASILRDGLSCSVKVRSTMRDEPASIAKAGDDRILVEFITPQWAPAPGQSAVFYLDDMVLGGGIIEKSDGCPESEGPT